MNKDHTQGAIVAIAVIGSLVLGFLNPKELGSLAISLAGTAVGGYYGLQQNDPKDKS